VEYRCKALRGKPHDGAGCVRYFCVRLCSADQAGLAAIEATVLAVGAVGATNQHCFRLGEGERPKWEVDRLSSVRSKGGRLRNVYSDCSCRIRAAVFDDFHRPMLRAWGYLYFVAGEALRNPSPEPEAGS
jgi:hypothetical protein